MEKGRTRTEQASRLFFAFYLQIPVERRARDTQSSTDVVDRSFALVVEPAGKLDLAGGAGELGTAAFTTSSTGGL